MQTVEQQAAYILHRRAYRETSYILDVYSLEYGRISIVAKGATRGKNNFSALLQAFQPLLLSWGGRSNLKNLTSVEAPSAAFIFVSERLYCAFYLNELLLKLTPEADPNPILFSAYASALQGLKDKHHTESVLRIFELALLTSLGLAPDFLIDSSSNEIQSNLLYRLDPGGGFSLIKNGSIQREKWNSLKGHQPIFEGVTLLRIGNNSLIGPEEQVHDENKQKLVLREAKIIMRLLIYFALQGKELKSRALFKQLTKGYECGK
ncbi:MAG: DNA repair protein RecO (recombination protein O) [Pseudohongiellaceae bacterium]